MVRVTISMAQGHHHKAWINCTECPFSEVVTDADERRPADVVREHGEASGHKLSVEFPDK